jgi:hypothetical protein
VRRTTRLVAALGLAAGAAIAYRGAVPERRRAVRETRVPRPGVFGIPARTRLYATRQSGLEHSVVGR